MKIVIDTEKLQTTPYYAKNCVVTMEDIIKCGTPLKKGHWIKYGMPRCEEQHYKCTLCGYYINFGRWGEFYTREFKYCPHCGAEMDGEETESD